MSEFWLDELSNFGDYANNQELTDILTLSNDPNSVSDVRVSPDGRHIHIILRKPKVGLVTFDKYESPQSGQTHKKLELSSSRTLPVVDICYLDHHNNNNSSRGTAAVAVVYENGKAEFWSFHERKAGWRLLQTADLCNGPRARVVSVCACSSFIIWCEERPPPESSPSLGSTRNKLEFCVCRRDFEVEDGSVSLGGVKITLHNSPKFTVMSSGCGGLLLLLSTGWLCLLQKDGTLRHVYKLPGNSLAKHGTHTSFCMYQNILALVVGQTLHLIESSCGKELQTFLLKAKGMLFVNPARRQTPFLLSDTGLFVVLDKKTDASNCSSKVKPVETVHPEALLVEAVFEEACKYYQQRSLSSTQLTVDALKRGRFQAPISLASILRCYLSTGLRKKDAEMLLNPGGGLIAGQGKLMVSLEGELRILVSLEELKGSLVRGGPKEVEVMCENLVEKEMVRLLSSSELDKEALLYLNSIFSIFPCQAWRAAQAALQLHYNGEGSLSSRAPPDVWKTVLSLTTTSSPTAVLLFTNGQPKRNHGVRNDHTRKPAAFLPVFELLCRSILHFQPTWLPKFLELAQQQQGSAGLGLSLASSSWSFSGGRGGEGGENNMPLYRRALCVLSGVNPDGDQDLEVELLLVGGRPNAILQALRILMRKQQWERVTQVAQRFCKQSPLLNKEIFTTLLCEVTHHRDLDPYLDLLWALCPEDFTVTTILNLVLKNLPSPHTPSHPATFFMSHATPSSPSPFADPDSSQLTIGLLKPLLRKVLQRETKPSQRYVDILQSPLYPPPALPRQPTDPLGCVTDPSADSAALRAETPELQSSTNIQRSGVALPADPLT
uniref:HPS6 biosis of lysosomal organelles complex 2 subunit 3 n=1 Tax=Nothobranchius furzeri TaxID=105023 RepID=A0A8C6KT10_NOTFU